MSPRVSAHSCSTLGVAGVCVCAGNAEGSALQSCGPQCGKQEKGEDKWEHCEGHKRRKSCHCSTMSTGRPRRIMICHPRPQNTVPFEPPTADEDATASKMNGCKYRTDIESNTHLFSVTWCGPDDGLEGRRGQVGHDLGVAEGEVVTHVAVESGGVSTAERRTRGRGTECRRARRETTG